MIDEEELAELLQELGDSFEVSNEAQAAILETATPEPRKRPNKSTPSRSRVPSTRKGKGVLVAAALLMVLAGGITFAVASPNSSVHQASGPSAASAKSPFLSRASGGAAGGSGGAYGVGSNHRGIAGTPAGVPRTTANPQVPPKVGQSAKVVANGTVDLTVKKGSLQAVIADLTEVAGSYGGFVASTQAQYGNVTPLSPPSATIVLRVPEASFGSAVTQVQRYGQATSVNTTSNDVTGQYVNLQARIWSSPGEPQPVPEHPQAGDNHSEHPHRPELDRLDPEQYRADAGAAERLGQRDRLRNAHRVFDRTRSR